MFLAAASPLRMCRTNPSARTPSAAGCAVYLNGDIPWTGANDDPGTLLGLTQPFLSYGPTSRFWLTASLVRHLHPRPARPVTLDFSPPLSLALATSPRPSPPIFPTSKPHQPIPHHCRGPPDLALLRPRWTGLSIAAVVGRRLDGL